MTGPVETVSVARIRVGDTIASMAAAEWMTVARITSNVVEREIDLRREAFRVFTFEDGQQGERVWIFRETDVVVRQT
jgi:hypothetical protein